MITNPKRQDMVEDFKFWDPFLRSVLSVLSVILVVIVQLRKIAHA